MTLLDKNVLDDLLKSVRMKENIKLVGKVILSQEDQPWSHSAPKEIARELDIDRRSESRIIDQDLGLHTLRERKVQILTDLNIWKAHDPFKKATVKVSSENTTNCTL